MIDGWNEEKEGPPKSYYTTDTFRINGRDQLRIYQGTYYWILSGSGRGVIKFYTTSLLFRECLKSVITKSNISQSVEFFKYVVRKSINKTVNVKIYDNDLLMKFMEEGCRYEQPVD